MLEKGKAGLFQSDIRKKQSQPFSKISGKKTDEENFLNYHNNTGLDSL